MAAETKIGTGAAVAIGAVVVGVLALAVRALATTKPRPFAPATAKPPTKPSGADLDVPRGASSYWRALFVAGDDDRWHRLDQRQVDSPAAAWPLFEELTRYAPPYYYAGLWQWNGAAYQLVVEQCNSESAGGAPWCKLSSVH